MRTDIRPTKNASERPTGRRRVEPAPEGRAVCPSDAAKTSPAAVLVGFAVLVVVAASIGSFLGGPDQGGRDPRVSLPDPELGGPADGDGSPPLDEEPLVPTRRGGNGTQDPGDANRTPVPTSKIVHRNPILLGAWLGDWPSRSNDLIAEFEGKTETRLDLVDIYLDWYTPFKNVSSSLKYTASYGAVPVLSWEAHGLTTKDITAGTKSIGLRDGRHITVATYLDEFAAGTCQVAKDTGQTILIRPMHEMNGDWFSWSVGYRARDGSQPNTDESYREAWITIHEAFRAHCGPDEVRFVWAVNHASKGDGTSYTGTYPGDQYVDYAGIDGYNWGAFAPWGWQSFDTIFADAYCEVTGVSGRPVFIAEWGSVESGGDKPAWIRDAFALIQGGAYSRVRAMVWLDSPKTERETGQRMDWQIDSTDASLSAYVEAAGELQNVGVGDTGDAGTACL